MNKAKIISLTILLLMFILFCSKKSNFIGFEEDIEDKIITDTLTNSINFKKSYKDSISNYQGNTKLIVGKFNGVEVRSLLKFKNLPDTSWINTVSIDSCIITIKKDTLINNDNFDIKIYEVTKDWNENSVIWDSLKNYFDDFEEQIGYDIYSDILQYQDTISFQIDTTLVKSWIKSDSTNFGIMLKITNESIDNNFVEFSSSENSNYPNLEIFYKDSSDADTTFNCKTSEDTFIGYDNFFVSGDTLSYPLIGNLSPTRTIIRLNIDSLSNAFNTPLIDLEKITINFAEIIIESTMIDSYFIFNSNLEIEPYTFYISDTTSSYACKPSPFSPDLDLSINITGILQGQIRDILNKNQIFLISTTENKDFSYIKFKKEDFKPRLKIIYTKPVLKD